MRGCQHARAVLGSARWPHRGDDADCVERAALQWSHDAMVFPGKRATFPEFAARADDIARALHGLGIAPGETIGIRMEQTIDYYAVLVGAAKIGAIGVPISVRFKGYELAP